jgi:hypothetical protein
MYLRRGHRVNDYTITLAYDLFNIITVVYADNEDEAKRFALQKLDLECGIPLGEPMWYELKLEGKFTE